MFVQATKSKRQNKTYVSYLVRESFRTSQGPRSRTVCNISALPPEVRELVAAALSGQTCVVHTDLEATQCAKEQVLGNYKNLLAVEDAFCQLKSYMEVRPVFHWRPDRVRNHVRLCFIAYWL